jgi:long-subunit fatty acid transport protein
VVTVVIATVLAAAPAGAGPMDEGHVGVPGFSSPTSGDLGAVYWNPAALGLMKKRDFVLVGAFRHTRTRTARDSIDPGTGQSPGPLVFGRTTSRIFQHPFDRWLAPGSMVALGGGIQDRWSFAVAFFSPFAYRARFRPTASGQEPNRYHLVEADVQNLNLAPSLAIRVTTGLYIGATLGWLTSRGRLAWDEDSALDRLGPSEPLCGDLPCGMENPAAAERYDLTDVKAFDDVINTLALGALLRRGPVDVGLSYTKQMIGGDNVRFIPGRTAVKRADRLGGREQVVASEVYFKLPDMATAGVTWNTPRWSLHGMGRWIRYSKHRDLDVRVAGSGLRQEMTLYRGYRDNLDVRARLQWSPGPRWRLSGTIRGETSAVSAEDVSAASVDGLKLEPMIAAEVKAGFFRLSAAYSFLIIPEVRVDRSRFDPGAALACSATGNDLTTPGCQLRSLGAARSTTVGRYGLQQHALYLATTLSF